LNANYANFLLKAVAYNVFSLFKTLVLEKKFRNKTIATIRYFIIYIPGKMVKNGKGAYLSLIKNYRFIYHFDQWLEKSMELA
jgi:hypothetical protein